MFATPLKNNIYAFYINVNESLEANEHMNASCDAFVVCWSELNVV